MSDRVGIAAAEAANKLGHLQLLAAFAAGAVSGALVVVIILLG